MGDQTAQEAEQVTEITFHYKKSQYYRMIHVDGVYGGLTPRGTIIASMFSERPPIAKSITQSVVDGRLGEEIGRDSLEGIVREVDVGMVMSKSMAQKLVGWLQEKIQALDDAQKLAEQEEQTNG